MSNGGRRLGIVLAGSGGRDGTEIHEALAAALAAERAGVEVGWIAPVGVQAAVVDHRTSEPDAAAPKRDVQAESARLARTTPRALADVTARDLIALVVPGGAGATNVLSNYTEKGATCDVDAELSRLLRDMLAAHKPMGFSGGGILLAARVLGPAAGVRITLGSKASTASKHAALMGAEVRLADVGHVYLDENHHVATAPTYLHPEVKLRDVATEMEKMVRSLLHWSRQSKPKGPRPPQAARPSQPAPSAPAGAPILRRRPA